MASREELERKREARNKDNRVVRDIANTVYGPRVGRVIDEKIRNENQPRIDELRAARNAEPTPREAQMREGLKRILPAENNAHSPGKSADGKVVFSRED